MRGTIFATNQQRGMVAVQTEDAGFSVFELLGRDSIELSDEVKWNDDTALGSTMLTNITQGRTFEVYFQNHWVSKGQLRQQLLLE